MQISTASLYTNARAAMASLTEQANDLETQISTKKRMSGAADDVVGYQRLAGVKRDAADATADAANVKMAQALLQQSDSTLSSISDAIQQAQTLATQANTGVLSDGDKANIAASVRGVLANLIGLANTADPRGAPLFGGTGTEAAVALKADGSATFPTSQPAAIPLGDGQNVVPTENAARVFGGIKSADGSTTDVFAMLSQLATALEAGGDTGAAVSKAVTDLQSAGTQVSSVQASLGARAARVDLVQQQQTAAATDREVTRQGLEDTDIPGAITQLQQTMTVLQATQASFTKLAQLSLFNYLS
jgi:flagellar hook-associated protein 3 FlgL